MYECRSVENGTTVSASSYRKDNALLQPDEGTLKVICPSSIQRVCCYYGCYSSFNMISCESLCYPKVLCRTRATPYALHVGPLLQHPLRSERQPQSPVHLHRPGGVHLKEFRRPYCSATRRHGCLAKTGALRDNAPAKASLIPGKCSPPQTLGWV